jgi:hypothetical protein
MTSATPVISNHVAEKKTLVTAVIPTLPSGIYLARK